MELFDNLSTSTSNNTATANHNTDNFATELIQQLEDAIATLEQKLTAKQQYIDALVAEKQQLLDLQENDKSVEWQSINQQLQEEIITLRNQLLEVNTQLAQNTQPSSTDLSNNYEYKRLQQENQILETKNKILQREKENLRDEKQVILQQLEVLTAEKENLWQKNLEQSKIIAATEQQHQQMENLKLKLLDFVEHSRTEISLIRQLMKQESA